MIKSLLLTAALIFTVAAGANAQSVNGTSDGSPAPVACIAPFFQLSQSRCDEIAADEKAIILAVGPCYKVDLIWLDPFSGARSIHCWEPPTPEDIRIFGPGSVGNKLRVYGQNWDLKANNAIQTVALANDKDAWATYKMQIRMLAGLSVSDQAELDNRILEWARSKQ
jgi:hypothetical protein